MKAISSFLNSGYFWSSFAVLAVFVYFFGLTVPLLGPDEPRYAQVAREMWQRGDWVTPTLGGFHWFEKPALLYWLQKTSYSIFGVSEFSARFGSAIFGLGTAVCAWILGKAAGGSDKTSIAKPEAEKYLALVAASALGLIVFSRGASFDIILTFPIAASMTGYFVFDQAGEGEKRRSWGLAAFYFFIGVAVLAKGLVGFVFPFAIVGFYHVLRWRSPSKSLLLSPVWGLPLAMAVAASWYLPMYLRHGWEFIDEFFVQHHFQRYTSNKYRHPQPFHFFFWVLPLMTIPWIPFFLAELWRTLKALVPRKQRESQNGRDEHGTARKEGGSAMARSPLAIFAFAWMSVPLVFFSFSGSKLPGYILPAVPPALILAGLAAYRFSLRSEFRAASVKALALITLVVIVIVIQFALPYFAEKDSVKDLITAAERRVPPSTPVAGFMTISHNAEFYAAGRLLRFPDGTQKRLNDVGEVAAFLGTSVNRELLVILRREHVHFLRSSPLLICEVVAESGEYAIAVVRTH